MNNNLTDENLFLQVIDDDDSDTDTNKNNVSNILNLIDNGEENLYGNNLYGENLYGENLYAELVNYKMNYNIKQLQVICEYYGISKTKIGKTKDDIINNIISFENDLNNINIVFKRKQMWHFMEEIKADKFMKKFVLLWN
jgi:hypothetical protein